MSQFQPVSKPTVTVINRVYRIPRSPNRPGRRPSLTCRPVGRQLGFFAISLYFPGRKLTAKLPAAWPSTFVARWGERFATNLQHKRRRWGKGDQTGWEVGSRFLSSPHVRNPRAEG